MKTQQVAAIKKSFRPFVKNFVISAEPCPQWKTEKASYSRIQDIIPSEKPGPFYLKMADLHGESK